MNQSEIAHRKSVIDLNRFPRVNLGTWPTPLEPALRLSAALGGPEIWIKRDDLSTLGLGGNKVRKLEYLLADALAKGCDVILTTGAAQSNHARLTAAACARLGLRCVLVLRGKPDQGRPGRLEGNLLLDHLFGAEVRLVDCHPDERNAIMTAMAAEMATAGHQPYTIPVGGSTGLGALGYARCAQEIAAQAASFGLRIDVVVSSSSSGGTQGGLVLGQKGLRLPFAVWGISADYSRAELQALVSRVATEAATLVDGPVVTPAEVCAFDEYVGPGYGVVTEGCREAVRLFASTEGIILDPVYTGKAAAGLIDLIRRKELRPGQRVVFIHTGGSPAIFAYGPEM